MQETVESHTECPFPFDAEKYECSMLVGLFEKTDIKLINFQKGKVVKLWCLRLLKYFNDWRKHHD